FPLPVLTGIGHDMDESILDQVAHTSLKTPTAVADFIISHNLFFENKLLQIDADLNILTQEKIQEQYFILQNAEQTIRWQTSSILKNQNQFISFLKKELNHATQLFLQKEKNKLAHLKEIYQLLSPEQTLKRGFSITSINGKIIHSSKDALLEKNTEITTQLQDGTIKSKIK
ncbi:MAG TPA: hypothetical protein ENJ53_08100, partial [Phaeodactylibacter sp.]|nr:hypothetical protein [Phaeodactylibacter sp.]